MRVRDKRQSEGERQIRREEECGGGAYSDVDSVLQKQQILSNEMPAVSDRKEKQTGEVSCSTGIRDYLRASDDSNENGYITTAMLYP